MTKAKKTTTKKTGSRKGAKAATTATVAPQAAQGGKKAKGSATKATRKQKADTAKQGAKPAQPAAARDGSKKAQVLEMMRRADGAGLKEIMEATGWQAHSVRGALAGTLRRHHGLEVTSSPEEGRGRAYRVLADASEASR